MSLFDNRTDTEKELDNYNQQKNNKSSNRPKSPFDLPEGYNKNNNTNRKSPFDLPDGYKNTNNNNSYNQFNDNTNNNSSCNQIDDNKSPENNKTGKKKSSPIYGVIFLVLIVGLVAVIILLLRSFFDWALILFGLVLLVLGTVAICNTKRKLENSILFIVWLAGAGFFVGGLINIFGDESLRAILYNAIPFFILGLAVLSGLQATLIPVYTRRAKEKRCKIPITATIVEMKRRHTRRSTWYAPIYEYSYNGKLYKETGDTHYNESSHIGEQKEIYINSEEPEDFYTKDLKEVSAVTAIIISVIVVLMFSMLVAFFIAANV